MRRLLNHRLRPCADTTIANECFAEVNGVCADHGRREFSGAAILPGSRSDMAGLCQHTWLREHGASLTHRMLQYVSSGSSLGGFISENSSSTVFTAICRTRS